jgi:hypothetical protein
MRRILHKGIERDLLPATRFPIANFSAAVLTAIGVAVNDLWQHRGRQRQQISVDAAAEDNTLRLSSGTASEYGSYAKFLSGVQWRVLVTATFRG